MIDTRTRETLEYDMATAIREHSKARAELLKARDQVAELALKNEPIPQDLRDTISDAESDLDYLPDHLEELKQAYIQLIKNIKIRDM